MVDSDIINADQAKNNLNFVNKIAFNNISYFYNKYTRIEVYCALSLFKSIPN